MPRRYYVYSSGYRSGRRRRVPRVAVAWWLLVLVFLGGGLLTWQRSGRRTQTQEPVLTIFRTDLQQTVKMPLETYIIGVVAAEMPATFHPEALRAQAVAARTYALRALMDDRRVPEHGDAVLSTDFRTAQAFVDISESRSSAWLDPIIHAVKDTRGMVITYEGNPINAVYHSTSGGRTEAAGHYWSGSSPPYLQSVEDPWSSHSPYAITTALIPIADILTQLEQQSYPVTARQSVVEVLSHYPSGRVESVRVGEAIFSGRAMRERLGLRSSWFEVEQTDDTVRFTVRGYGHGVGLSQYGADGMGKAGKRFDDIVKHYYPGTAVSRWYR